MAQVEEDSISIVITADGSKAEEAFDSVMAKLEALQQQATTSSSSFDGFGGDIAGKLKPAIDALAGLADSSKSLKGFGKTASGVSKGLGALGNVSDDVAQKAGRNVGTFASSIGDLSSMDTSSMAQLASSIGGVGDAVTSFGNVKPEQMRGVTDNLRGLGSAAGGVAAYGTGIANLGKGLKDIPEGLGKFGDAGAFAGNVENFGTVIDSLTAKLSTLSPASMKAFSAVANLGKGLKGIPQGLEQFADISSMTSQVENFGTVIGQLSSSLGSFGEDAQQAVRSLRSLTTSVSSLSAMGADSETLSASLGAASTALKAFVSDLNAFATSDNVGQFEALAASVDKVAQAYDKLGASQKAVKNAPEDKSQQPQNAFTSLGSNITSALSQAKPVIDFTSQLGGVSGQLSGSIAGTATKAASLATAFGSIGTTGGRVVAVLSLVANAAQKAGQVLSKLGQLAYKGLSTALNAAKQYLAIMAKIASVPINNMVSGIQGVAQVMSRLVSMAGSAVYYNALFSVLRVAMDGLTTGVQNLYQWALLTGNQFAASMDSCATSVQYFQNSIGAAAGALLSSLAPALDAIVDHAVAAINAINQLIAALTGAGTWNKAIKVQKAFGTAAAGSGNKAAKGTNKAKKALDEYKNTVLGFDELNKLNDTNDSGSGSGGGAGGGGGGGGGGIAYDTMFQETPIDDFYKQLANTSDWTELGKRIADAINSWEYSIDWDSIDKTAKTWSTRVWTALNGFIDERDWSSFGYTIARGLNVGLHFIDDIAQHVRFDDLGAGLAGALNKAVETIDPVALGHVMTDKLKIALEILHGFMVGNETYEGFNFDALRDRLATAIDAAFDNIPWATAATDVSSGIGEIALTAATAISELAVKIDEAIKAVDWVGFGQTIAGYLNDSVKAIDWSAVGRVLGDGLYVALNALHGFLSSFDWEGFRKGMSDAIDAAFEEIDWATAAQDIATALGEISKTLLSFAGTIFSNLSKAMSQVDWGDLGRQLGQFVNDMYNDVDWDAVGQALSGLFGGALEFLLKGAETYDWLGLARHVCELLVGMVRGIDWGAVGQAILGFVVDLIGDVFVGIGQAVASVDWAGLGQTILQGVQTALGAAVQWIIDKIPAPIKDAFSGLVDWVSDLLSPTPAYAQELADDTGQSYSDGLDGKTDEVGDSATDLFKALKDGIKPAIDKAGDWGSTTTQNLSDGVSSLSNEVSTAATGLYDDIHDGLKPAWDKASQWGNDVSSKLSSGIDGMARNVTDSAKSLYTTIHNGIQPAWDKASGWGRDVSNKLGSGISGAVYAVSNAASTAYNNIKYWLTNTPAWNWGRDVVSAVSNGLSYGVGWVSNAASTAYNNIKYWLTNIPAWNWGRDVVSSISNGLSYGVGWVSNAASDAYNRIKYWLTGIPAWNWGRDVMSSLSNGIWSGINWVRDAASAAADKIRSFLHFSEPDEGPLSDFHTYMPDMMRQMAQGISSNAGLVTGAVDDLAQDMARSMADGLSGGRRLVTDSMDGLVSGVRARASVDLSASYDAGQDYAEAAQATIANAVALGVVGSQGTGQQAASDRPITLVLRIGNEDIARATYRGIDSLASRGVIQPEFV